MATLQSDTVSLKNSKDSYSFLDWSIEYTMGEASFRSLSDCLEVKVASLLEIGRYRSASLLMNQINLTSHLTRKIVFSLLLFILLKGHRNSMLTVVLPPVILCVSDKLFSRFPGRLEVPFPLDQPLYDACARCPMFQYFLHDPLVILRYLLWSIVQKWNVLSSQIRAIRLETIHM